jgi:hypothetical protein
MMAWPFVLVFTPLLAHLLRRRAELSARGGVLTVQSTHLLFARSRSWRRDEWSDDLVDSLLPNCAGKVRFDFPKQLLRPVSHEIRAVEVLRLVELA